MENWKYIILIQVISFGFLEVNGGPKEKTLLNDLFDINRKDAHNPLERPAKNDSKPLLVRLGVYLTQILDLDEKNEIFKVNVFLYLRWHDYYFNWDPNFYDGITVLSLPPEKLWKPDIILFNSVDEKNMAPYSANIKVFNSGIVVWGPPGVFKATCDIDVTLFPFDSQTCYLVFGSWTYTAEYIDLHPDCLIKYNPRSKGNCTDNHLINLSEYYEHNEFTITNASLERSTYIFAGENFIQMHAKISIRRRPYYYIFNYIFPCMLVSIMAIMVFMLPSDSGEKISLGVTVLLSMTMFLLLVADKLPQSSLAVPLLCKYFLCIMILCSLSLVFTIIVLVCYYRSMSYHPVPSMIKIGINRWLAKILFIGSVGAVNKNEDLSVETEENLRDVAVLEWQFAARVIDRFCLIMFSLFIVISTIVIFSIY